MSSSERKTWLVTGSSGGLGFETTKAVLRAGHYVVATSRNLAKDAKLVAEVEALGGAWECLDVASDELEMRLDRIISTHGHIDVVFNCAGFALAGTVEDTSLELAHSVFATNFWGPARIIKHLLPGMRERKSGTIINVASAEVYAPHPSLAFYAATKSGIASFTEVLHKDLTGMGIKVLLAEPGGIRTGFNESGKLVPLSKAYEGGMVDHVLKALLSTSGKQGGDPARMAQRIVEAAMGGEQGSGLVEQTVHASGKPLFRVPLGSDLGSAMKGRGEELGTVARDMKPCWASADFPSDETPA